MLAIFKILFSFLSVWKILSEATGVAEDVLDKIDELIASIEEKMDNA